MINYLGLEFANLWACDVEGDPIPSTKVFCVVAINLKTREVLHLTTYEEIKAFFDEKKALGHKFIFHNGLGYDGPTLNRLCATRLSVTDIIDTMVMSQIYSPSLEGGHSLAAWGKRLSFPKTEFDDFSCFTPEMLAYCENDTELCLRVYIALRSRMNKLEFSNEGLDLEHRSWSLIKRQQDNGFAFNIKEAHVLYALLRQKEKELEQRVHEYWPPRLECVGTFKRPYKKDGGPTANFERHQQQYVDVRVKPGGDEYEVYDYVYFNIGSPAQRVEKLLALGWEPKPDELTKAGQPSPTRKGQLVPSLVSFSERLDDQRVQPIAQWIEINARANMINTWIEAYNEQTGCIHGSLWVANTLRYRHSNPNTANIPAVRVDKQDAPLRGDAGSWTYEARDLWTVRSPDRLLVGVDAKGIQLRVLAHYLNNPEFTEAVLGGDPHSYNQKVGGFATRSIAKTFIYAFLLGAGDAKVGQIIGGSTKDGKEIKARFIGNFPGLANLLDDLGRQVERTGRIVLCDRTPLIVSAPHTRLGYLLQGDESRIMKKAAIIAAAENHKRKLDVIKVGDIHDEWQNDVLAGHAQEFATEVCPYSFKLAGESFNYRLPIDCDAKIGRTWAETH